MPLRKWFCASGRRGKRVNSKALMWASVVLAGLVLTGSTSAWAQVEQPPCTSLFPNYRPDFTNNQNCMALNDAAAFGPAAANLPPPETVPPNPPQPAPAGVTTVLRLTPNTTFVSGSAWFKTPISVAGGFSATFTFQLSGTTTGVGDGIAFLIQNSGTSAIDADNGTDGCSIGFGEVLVEGGSCTASTGGIPKSLAVEFDTFQNGDIADISNNHVAIQSCGTSPNTVDSTCRRADFNLNTTKIVLPDGSVHTATVTYTPPSPQAVCDGSCPGTLDVILDGVDLFPNGGVSFDITSLGLGEGGTAFAGFTAATGGADDNQDILSFVLTPFSSQTITQPAPANTFTTFTFGSYLYKVKPNTNINSLSVTEVPVNPAPAGPVIGAPVADPGPVFDPGPNFQGANCIVYDSTGGKCIEFHAVCTPPVPDDNSCNTVSYDVVTSYDVPVDPNTMKPLTIVNPGFLKATGQSCPPALPFDSNIITQFIQLRTDPTTKGSSKPTFSCFVAVQNVTYQPADLDIINLAAAKVKPGATLTYVATVTDFGPSAAQGVAINNTIPAGTTYVSSSLCSLTNGCSNTPCSFNGTVASCQVGNLAEFGLEFMVVNVKVTALAGTVISDTATITGFNPDPDKVPDRSWTAKTLVSTR